MIVYTVYMPKTSFLQYRNIKLKKTINWWSYHLFGQQPVLALQLDNTKVELETTVTHAANCYLLTYHIKEK